MKIAFAIAALMVSSAASAQVAVGVIDTNPGRFVSSNVVVEYTNNGTDNNMVRQESQFSHGRETLAAIVSEFKPSKGKQLHIVMSSPFVRFDSGKAATSNVLKMDWVLAMQALQSMAAKGVRVVCTTFVTNREAEARAFAAEAKRLNITIVASIGNGETVKPFPAMIGDNVVSVASSDTSGYAAGTEYMMDKAQVKFNGRSALSKESLFSSSVASARKCGNMVRG